MINFSLGVGVPRGRGALRRRRGRARLAAPARRGLGARRLRAPGAGEPRPLRRCSRPWRELRARVDDVLDRAGGRPGHVFNVGHGLVPQTPVDNVRRLVEHVRERTSRERPAADRRARHGLRRPGVAGRDPGYLADIRRGRPDAARGARGDHGELPRDRRPLAAPRGRRAAGRRARHELGDGYRCYLGMRHWAPWIEDVVGEMVEDGVTHAVGLVLAPHFSALSVARYQQKVADGLELHRGRIEFEHVPSYHDAPGLVEAFAARRARARALAGGRARPRPRRLQRAQPARAGARRRATRTTSSASRPRASSPSGRMSRRALVVELPVGRPHARAVGGARSRRAPRGARRARRARRRLGPGRVRLRPRRAPVRRRRPGARDRERAGGAARAPAGAERRPAVRRALADVVAHGRRPGWKGRAA